MPSAAPLRVLVVDDSASIRAVFSAIIRADPGLALYGTAADPFEAVELMRKDLPDVMLLDLELPRMDGLTFLRKIMKQHPMPVVVCSNYTESGSRATMNALEGGAAEVLAKPKFDTLRAKQEAAVRIGDALRAAVASRSGNRRKPPLVAGEKLPADVILPLLAPRKVPRTMPVVAIGASTGGTEALREVLSALPASAPATVIVQHMPENFTRAFANRLNGLCQMEVREACDGDVLRAGLALIAPGNHHMVLHRTAGTYRVEIKDGPCVSRHRPSVDVLFRSAAQDAGENALGIILTGMGDDGATCMAEMRANGAQTIGQNEESCVVYGMPREAMAHGGVMRELPLTAIAGEITEWARRRESTQ